MTREDKIKLAYDKIEKGYRLVSDGSKMLKSIIDEPCRDVNLNQETSSLSFKDRAKLHQSVFGDKLS